MLTNLSSVHIEQQIQQAEAAPYAEQVRIGVLALQGAYKEHCFALYKAGAKPVEIRSKEDLRNLHGLCLPGGESTVMAKLLVQNAMLEELKKMILGGMPVLATCAGLILLSKELPGFENQPRLECLDVTVRRNAFGRQKESFTEEMDIICPKISLDEEDRLCRFPAVFIRAPQIEKTGNGVRILAQKDGTVLAVQQNAVVAAAFHPELTENTLFHAWLYQKAKDYKEQQ